MLDLNTRPYFDDFKEDSKFYKILFRPSFAVQARELTQLQTILQNQIKLHGDHIFKEGAMVIPGQMSIDMKVDYVKLSPTYLGESIVDYVSQFEGQTITNEGGLTAQVLKVVVAEGDDPATLYVRYTNSGDDGVSKVFQPDEILTTSLTFGDISVQVQTTDPTGKGSAASIERGVYYVYGHFVLVEAQYIIVEKYSTTPSYRIGLTVDEQLITPEDDATLLDNAQGSYNFAAPGAHRYFIDLILSTKSLTTEEDASFVELLRVENGEIKRHVTKTAYSELEKTLARRTYDESGDYTVRNFAIDVREHRNNNRGNWTQNTAYLIGDVVVSNGSTYVARRSGTSINVAPSHTSGTAWDGPGFTGVEWEYATLPYYNRGVYRPEDGGDESKLAVGLEPGKAYIRGYEVEKIATEYVAVDKSRESVSVNNAVIPATIGNFVYVTNTNNLPPVPTAATSLPSTYGIVAIYNRVTGSAGKGTGVGTQIGTARVRFYEKHDGTVYKLGLFDVKMNAGRSFDREAKSFFYNVSGNSYLSFTADISPDYVRLVGSASTSGSSTTVTGTGTSFQTDLIVGDYVQIGTELRRVTAIASQTQITVDAAVNVTGVTIDRAQTKIVEPNNSPALFPLPFYAIKSVTTSDTTYTVYERFTATSLGAVGGQSKLTISTTNGTFASAADTDNYIVVNNSSVSGGAIVTPLDFDVNGTTVDIFVDGSLQNTNFIVIAAVNKTGTVGTLKQKSLVTATPLTLTTAATATKSEILLGKADVYRVTSIRMDTGSFSSPTGQYTIDISDRYEIDSGQRPTHYDVGRLILKQSFVPPTAPIRIEFQYFTHGAGDYFTVDSYPSNISYAAIPMFNGTSLRDYIDFRPRIDDAGSTFVGTGGGYTLVPKRGIDVRADFEYYLARKTKIAIDFDGNFFAVNGVSSLNPGDPLTPSQGMVLYTLTLEPYTFSTTNQSVAIQAQDNRRYTMRDIGKLEKRIDNLEYYTALSLLEQQTESLDIIDNVGETRFKNGFIVDNFTGHTTGDTNSEDYLCSIDMENNELRPFFSMHNINLVEKNTTNSQRALGNYQLYGDVITLPVLDHIPLVKQEFASRIENINPFAVFTFLGNMELTPATDDWFEVNRRPDIVNEVEGNFNTIRTLAEKAGVLGTVWNSWQTQWTGTSVEADSRLAARFAQAWGANLNAFDRQLSIEEMNARFGDWSTGGWARRELTVRTSATQVGQQRTGIRTSVVAKIDRQVVADRVLSTAVIPYIRSRNILVQVRGLKPGTKFFPFFDNTNVAQYCTPASRIVFNTITGQSSAFDSMTNVGGLLGTDQARRIQGDSQVCLTRGDVITGQTSGATAVVVGTELDTSTNVRALYVVNIRGTFSPTETIIGSVSAARGSVVSVSAKSQGNDIVTNFNGEVALLFNIPNTEEIRFRTGVREFKLVDTSEAEGDFTSRGRQMYRAEGVLETRQQTVNAVRNGEIVQEQVAENRVIVQTSERVVADTGWYDPLAQTFLVENTGGAFLTKVDVFFATKDTKVPVNLEIREVVNGYPGKTILPFSRVSLKPEQVQLSNETVLLDGAQVRKYDTPTTFVFPSPVYVNHNTEYAIVLASDSNNYKVWISQVGDRIPGTTRTISEQPYQGVFFKSQNASTWTADQTQDLKFTIYKAKFAANTVANVEFVNDLLPRQRLDFDPLELRAGTNKIRVYQRDHGMPSGSVVLFDDLDATKVTGVTATGTISASTSSTTVTGVGTSFTSQLQQGSVLYTQAGSYIGVVQTIGSNTSLTLAANAAVAATGAAFKATAPIAGVPTTEVYKQHTISDVDLDSFVITVTTDATSSGYFGGSTIRATRNIQYDDVQPIVQVQTFPETQTSFGIRTVSGQSPDGSQTPYVLEPSFQPVLANENNLFASPRLVASYENQVAKLSGNNSVFFSVTMSTTSDSLSPIIDTQRISLVAVNNKIDAPTETNKNVDELDDVVVLDNNTTISFADNTIQSTNSTARAALQTIAVGKYITIAGSTDGANDGTFLVTAVSDDGSTATVTTNNTFTTQTTGASIDITLKSFFVDEIAPVGSSTYSKYVTRQINLAAAATFLRIRFAASIPPEASIDVYYKTAASGSTTSLDQVAYTKLASDAPVIYSQVGSDQFFDMNFSTGDIAPFDALQVKLVFRSTNTSAVPRVKDLRVVACV